MKAKQLTSGELIHRFRRKDEFGPDEWDKDLRRIVNTVEAEAVAAERRRLVALFTERRDAAREEWVRFNKSKPECYGRYITLDWAIQQIEQPT